MSDLLIEKWGTQLRKGLLELCVLNALKGRRMYGYDIVRALRLIDELVISEGTIYPLLSRLRRDGLLEGKLEESDQGPARKYYELTDRGVEVLGMMNTTWGRIVAGVSAIQSNEHFGSHGND